MQPRSRLPRSDLEGEFATGQSDQITSLPASQTRLFALLRISDAHGRCSLRLFWSREYLLGGVGEIADVEKEK